jgi:undecaprenyl-diphosphatase
MTYIQAIIIAIVEGLTEFLPISSTAHMKIVNPLIGVSQNGFTDLFEIVIQLAAILSVVVIYFKKFFDFKNFQFYIKLAIAIVPSLVVAMLLKKHIDSALGNLTFIACVMIGGGILLLFIDNVFKNPTIDDEKEVSIPKAIVIGCFQVLSIVFPGFSRSAATIIGGMSQKLTKRAAAEFSFFLAVPTMLAASTKSTYDVIKEGQVVFGAHEIIILLIGCVVSFLVALLAIKFFVNLVSKQGFKPFGVYRIIVGVLVLILIYTEVI